MTTPLADVARALDAAQVTRTLAAARLTPAQAAQLVPALEQARDRLDARSGRDYAAVGRLRTTADAALAQARAGRFTGATLEQQLDALERSAAEERKRLRSELVRGVRDRLDELLDPVQRNLLFQTVGSGPERAPARRGEAAGTGDGKAARWARRLLDGARALSPDEWEKRRAEMADRIRSLNSGRPTPDQAALADRLGRRLEGMERARAMSDGDYASARRDLGTELAREARASSPRKDAAEELDEFIGRSLLAAPAIRAVRVRAGLPAVAPDDAPSEAARDANEVRAAVAEIRAHRALVLSGTGRAHGAALLSAVESAERERESVEDMSEIRLQAAAERLLAALPRLWLDPRAPLAEEAACERVAADHAGRLDAVRAAGRRTVIEALKSDPAPDRGNRILTVARELLRASLITDGHRSIQASAVEDVKRELERLRRAPDERYPRLREISARRNAGVLLPDEVRGRQHGALPALADAAVRARVRQQATAVDRIRTMSAEVWRNQRTAAARRIAIERKAAAAHRATPDELLAHFADRVLLQPQSLNALRARFG